MRKPKTYPLVIVLWQGYAYSKGYHDPDSFVKALKAGYDIEVDPAKISHKCGKCSWSDGEYQLPCLDYAVGPGRGVFPITEVTLP